MLAKALRPGLLAGSICGVLGVAVLACAGLGAEGTLLWALYVLVPLAAGPLGAWLLGRGTPARRADLVRAGLVAGAAGGIWLGLLLLAQTVLIVTTRDLEGQMRDLLAQNGLDPRPAPALSGLVLACAGSLFVFVMPLITAALGALAAGAYSFARPPAPAG